MLRIVRTTLIGATVLMALLALAGPAAAQAAPAAPSTPVTQATPTAPAVPATAAIAPEAGDPTSTSDGAEATVSIDLGNTSNKPSQSLLIIISLTVMAVAPALLVMMTSFTRIVIVLSLTRNALGVQAIPPNQIIVGLALFLSLFVMGPVFSEINEQAVQPMLRGEIAQGEAFERATGPLRTFMLAQTRKAELGMFVAASGAERPTGPEDVSLIALIPAFILSELKTAFIIGFIVFIPFLVIDMFVSSSLMSMGMMMLPPVLVSLPFKLLLFVMVDGWALVVRSLLSSFT